MQLTKEEREIVYRMIEDFKKHGSSAMAELYDCARESYFDNYQRIGAEIEESDRIREPNDGHYHGGFSEIIGVLRQLD